ncbi:MAG: hypothetical protein AAF789_06615, partial [Bacteroidota bacterium]
MSRVLIATFLFLVFQWTHSQDQVELIIPTGHTSQIQKICVDEDTTIVASIQNTEEIIIWDYSTTEKKRVLRYHSGRVNDLLLDQKHLISGGDDKQVFVWDLPTKKIIGKLPFGEQVFSIFVEDDHQLIIIGKNGKILRWNYVENQKGDSITLGAKIYASTLATNTNRIVAATKEQITLLNEQDLSIAKQTPTNGEIINALRSVSDNVFFGNNKGELVTLDLALTEKKRIKVFDFRLYTISESSQFNELILGGRDQTDHLKIYKISDESLETPSLDLGEVSALSAGGIRAITISKYETVFVPDYDFGISSFDLPDFSFSHSYQGLSFPINDISLSNDQRLLAVASSNPTIVIHDLSGVKSPQTIEGHKGGVSSVTFHPTDSLLASVGFDEKLKIWSLKDGKLKSSYNIRGDYITTPIQFNVAGQYLIQKTSSDYFELFDLTKSKSKK